MKPKSSLKKNPKKFYLRLFLAFLIVIGLIFIMLVQSKTIIYNSVTSINETNINDPTETPFPVGVNPKTGEITEKVGVEEYVLNFVPQEVAVSKEANWFNKFSAKLAQSNWYQNLASPISRIIVVLPGERQEEVTKNIGDILNWTTEERELFVNFINNSQPIMPDGKFYPGKYIVTKDSSPVEIATLLNDSFYEKIFARYGTEASIVPIEDALIIASLLEREAYDFTDMRYISGIIWNRLFIDMKLQLDASLQYSKSTNLLSKSWWPKVIPSDKYIDSKFNTYKNKGLPPSPIANVNAASVIAAINPRKTDCFFYFHDKNGVFHCTKTYEEHLSLLRKVYNLVD